MSFRLCVRGRGGFRLLPAEGPSLALSLQPAHCHLAASITISLHLAPPLNVTSYSYLIIYDQGGVYADSDVACLRPMADVLRREDGLVAVWEDFNSKAKQFAWDPLPAQVRA